MIFGINLTLGKLVSGVMISYVARTDEVKSNIAPVSAGRPITGLDHRGLSSVASSPDADYVGLMAEQSAAVILSHPPEPVMRAMNSVFRRLLGTRLGRPLTEFMVLNFAGRKSGRQFSIPVSAHVVDGTLYALANAGWKVNFRGGTAADVVRGGETTTMRGELIEDPDVIADLFHRTATGYGASKAQRNMGLKFRDNGVPSLQEFRKAVDENNLVAIRFRPA